MVVRVQTAPFDAGKELALITEGNFNIGGVCSFIGLVRDITPSGKINAMTLEHYPGMTEKALQKIECEAHDRWPLESTLILHRYGKLYPGDQIVFVAATSSHRHAAFEACHFLIDWLKTQAPFWKLEDSPSGGRWVEARARDDKAAERWGHGPNQKPNLT
ncbi:MAG: molybdenum cofactor biosynthesis protein MoaE [Rhodospirillaceae bacterium TMED8]|nr:molybdenum cofactor biosynthesis protein MoaE [Magnetovibrio sp.]OUT47727.1 MAG: molybdenum cofactor biosynthesis protein MoaE [Rhodospirillaceae bacterium TMED8]